MNIPSPNVLTQSQTSRPTTSRHHISWKSDDGGHTQWYRSNQLCRSNRTKQPNSKLGCFAFRRDLGGFAFRSDGARSNATRDGTSHIPTHKKTFGDGMPVQGFDLAADLQSLPKVAALHINEHNMITMIRWKIWTRQSIYESID